MQVGNSIFGLGELDVLFTDYLKKSGDSATGVISFDQGLNSFGPCNFNNIVRFYDEIIGTDASFDSISVSEMDITGAVTFSGPILFTGYTQINDLQVNDSCELAGDNQLIGPTTCNNNFTMNLGTFTFTNNSITECNGQFDFEPGSTLNCNTTFNFAKTSAGPFFYSGYGQMRFGSNGINSGLGQTDFEHIVSFGGFSTVNVLSNTWNFAIRPTCNAATLNYTDSSTKIPTTAFVQAAISNGTANEAINANNVLVTTTFDADLTYVNVVGGTSGYRNNRVTPNLTYRNSTNTLNVWNLNVANPTIFDDFIGLDGSEWNWVVTLNNAASYQYFSGTYDASVRAIATDRIGMLLMNSGGTSGGDCFFVSQSQAVCPSNIKRLAFGFIPLGNGSLTAVGSDANNICQALGIANGTNGTGSSTPSTYWRLLSTGGTIPSWTLVENNVNKETISGTNLTGNLANKWCRAAIHFTNNGAFYYGVFENLSDGVSYTTALYPTTAANITELQFLSMMSTTSNATSKQIGIDYVLLECNTLPIGTTSSALSSR
jgi:hypothetical protein